jgi:hypothetical protein
VQQFTLKIAAFPESAADITSQPGNSTAHMRSIARMARKAFGTGPAERVTRQNSSSNSSSYPSPRGLASGDRDSAFYWLERVVAYRSSQRAGGGGSEIREAPATDARGGISCAMAGQPKDGNNPIGLCAVLSLIATALMTDYTGKDIHGEYED